MAARVTELGWVFRPDAGRPAGLRALSGAVIHSVGCAGADGRVEVVLRDGTRVRVSRQEIVAEQVGRNGSRMR